MTDDKTQRDDGNVIRSGVPPLGGTSRGGAPVIPAGIAPQMAATGLGAGAELLLNGVKHAVVKVIAKSTGEAEVFLSDRPGRRCVLKLYYPNFKPKDVILQQLKGLKHPDTVELIDYGYHGDRFFEVMEYAAGGSLMEQTAEGKYRYIPIRDLARLRQFTSEVVNALEFCHSRGIIHRDIKPENIFLRNADGTDAMIGDFGISSALDSGLSKHMTGQARTAVYAAPELYQSVAGKTVISKEVDYYALGITIIHVWSGADPFGELNELAAMRVKLEGRVAVPADMPQEVRNLVLGLITVEPSKRWGYAEVQRWLRGEPVTVHHRVVENQYGDFHFGVIDGQDMVVGSPEELADLLEKAPTQGKKHLYKGAIARWLEDAREQSLYVEVKAIVEDDYPTDQDAGLVKAVYVLDPARPFKTAGGVLCQTSEEIGDAVEREFTHYNDELKNSGNSPLFVYLEARGHKDVADTFRKYAQAYSAERMLNSIILDLQGRDRFKIDGFELRKPEEGLQADENVKAQLVTQLQNVESKSSIWLERFSELKDNIDKWRKLDRYNSVTLHYALDARAPFDFYGEKVFDVEGFDDAFVRHVTGVALQKELSDSGQWCVEAEFWLRHYQATSLEERVEHYVASQSISGDTLAAIHSYLIQSVPSLDHYYSRVKVSLARVSGDKLVAADVARRERTYVLNSVKSGLRPSNIGTYRAMLTEHLADPTFLAEATTDGPFARELDNGLRSSCASSYGELVLELMKSYLPKADHAIFGALAGYLASSCNDVDLYWRHVRPLVMEAQGAGLTAWEMWTRQEDAVARRRDELRSDFDEQRAKAQRAVDAAHRVRYGVLSKAKLSSAREHIAQMEKQAALAESQWKDDSLEAIEHALASMKLAEATARALSTLDAEVDREVERRKDKARKQTVRALKAFAWGSLLVGPITGVVFDFGGCVCSGPTANGVFPHRWFSTTFLLGWGIGTVLTSVVRWFNTN